MTMTIPNVASGAINGPTTVSTICSGDKSRSAIATGIGSALFWPPREAGGEARVAEPDGPATSAPSSVNISERRPNRPAGPPLNLTVRILASIFDW